MKQLSRHTPTERSFILISQKRRPYLTVYVGLNKNVHNVSSLEGNALYIRTYANKNTAM